MEKMKKEDNPGYYILMISVHGLIRSHNLELGRDADTGGQVKYVLEEAAALASRPMVERVDLITRILEDNRISSDYSQVTEPISDKARIVRISCGVRRYVRKEKLWSYLDIFADNIAKYLRTVGRAPDLIHAHYADAGYVGARVAALLDVPLAFTAHSLGKVKKLGLAEQGLSEEDMEREYSIDTRIDAEEQALQNAAMVVCSTHQEVEEQYGLYDHYQPNRMQVIPPGVDLSRFAPPGRWWQESFELKVEVDRFLREPKKPMILCVARADKKKNLGALLHAYGKSEKLRETANLVIVAGNRDDYRRLPRGQKDSIKEIIHLIDYYDLYGKTAFPKRHSQEEIPLLYRQAARSRGVFVNPAWNEPFGLTLLEAAASGLPVVATNDGGPIDIIRKLSNGELVDPADPVKIGEAINRIVTDRMVWRDYSRQGLAAVDRHYSWKTHAKSYLKVAGKVITSDRRPIGRTLHRRLVSHDRMLICDIDNTLTGDRKALARLMQMLLDASDKIGFGVASGRSLDLTLEALSKWDITMPNALITGVGTEIHYGPNLVRDWGYSTHINHRWKPEGIHKILDRLPGLKLQPQEGQGAHKISYFIDPEKAPGRAEVVRLLRRAGLSVSVIYSHGAFLDILPSRASKGQAIRRLATRWEIPLERIMVAGDSGNDEEMLVGEMQGVVVGNYSPELKKLRKRPKIYFAHGHFANGVIEAVEKFRWFDDDWSAAKTEDVR